jgi:hypothetical protein
VLLFLQIFFLKQNLFYPDSIFLVYYTNFVFPFSQYLHFEAMGKLFGILYISLYTFKVVLFLFQVLLSQCHRFRALVLLGRFLDMGPWAVDLVISITIRQIFVQFLSIFSKTVVLYDNWIRVSYM